jgi:hypothetical protein
MPADFADGSDADTLAGLSCSTDEIAQWTGSAWVCAATGDISSVAAGAGLNGGGDSGEVSLDVDFARDGSANTAARSDHDHNGGAINLSSADFTENDGDDITLNYKWNRLQDYIYLASTGSTSPPFVGSFNAPLHLPQGAVIESFTAYAYDQDQVNDMEVIFGCSRSELTTTNFEAIVSAFPVSTSGASGDIQSETRSSVIYPNVDNDTYSYWCRATLIVDDDTDLLRFYGARIEYSMP